ncbi:hypothetical protein SAMN05216304_101746 [Bosea sp. OK403]|uniref:hypothetical protein n=1 Tax=Bosea sp. OK403 TaxID=1855286 RepID=UPI0008EAC07F|nr:hypothetical protein [Bosea sp. OK403]SFI08054.1 hypothetical protein SAMN05216304_101746 [Bosea sp. OK403]
MVSLDIGADAILTLRYLPPYLDSDERAYLDALARIGERVEPYVLLTIFGGRRALSQAGEREQALWFKATKARLSRFCQACAIIRPDADEKTAETFRRLWPFPIIAEREEEAGRAFLLQYQADVP